MLNLSQKCLAIIAAFLLTAAGSARAGGLYVYVDSQGVPHYALQKIDDKYQLFESDGPALSDDVMVMSSYADAMTARLPNMSQYDKTKLVPQTPISLNGVRVPAPSKATLTRLLRSQALARYEPIIKRHARAFGVDVNLIKAVMAAESGFNAAAVSPKNAQGLMQVIPPTAARYGVTEGQLMSPERNIYAGVRYLADLSRMFKGRPELIVAAYNAGEGAVYKYNRSIPPYKETQNYVRTVLSFHQVYGGAVGAVMTTETKLAYEDTSKAQVRGLSSRRAVQRVSMKVGGRLNRSVVLE